MESGNFIHFIAIWLEAQALFCQSTARCPEHIVSSLKDLSYSKTKLKF
jgi:hypothetical protein